MHGIPHPAKPLRHTYQDGSLHRGFRITRGEKRRAGGKPKLVSSLREDLFNRAIAPEGDAVQAPRTLSVFAHPDDETVALGARLGRFADAHFVHVTDGAPRNEQDSRRHGFLSWREYRAARAGEFRNLQVAAGIGQATHECLEIADQDASHQLIAITRRVSEMIELFQPQVLFTHPFEGGHPDHDACAFAAHHAVRLRKARGQAIPLIIEAAFYNEMTRPGELLPCEHEVLQRDSRLTAQERHRKQSLIDCFTSQRETLRGFPDWERFRNAPEYDFRVPPHPPPLLYDRYPWGMTSTRFNQLANDAEDVLHDQA